MQRSDLLGRVRRVGGSLPVPDTAGNPRSIESRLRLRPARMRPPAGQAPARRARRNTANPSAPARTEAAKMPSFASATRSASANARSVMNRDTVNPIPATAAVPRTCDQATPSGSRPTPARTARALAAEDPDDLADDQSEDDPERHPARDGVGQPVRRQRHPGVREREQRHDDVARPWVERLLDARERRDGLSRQPREPEPLRRVGIRRLGVVLRLLRGPHRLVADGAGPLERDGWREEPEQHAGDRRMDAGFEERQPHPNAQRHVHDGRPDIQALEDHDRRDEPGGDGERRERDRPTSRTGRSRGSRRCRPRSRA